MTLPRPEPLELNQQEHDDSRAVEAPSSQSKLTRIEGHIISGTNIF
jgi:hypothetical protein